MIDFRHVLVTIASIFFALAIGVALGTGLAAGTGRTPMGDAAATDRVQDDGGAGPGEASGHTADAGRGDVDAERLRARLDRLEQVLAYADAYAAATGERLTRDRLSGRSVVVVAPEERDDAVLDDVRKAVGAAGGTVTGTVRLSEDWADPERQRFLEDLTAELTAKGVRLPEPPASVHDRAGAVLARALATTDRGAPAPDLEATRILGGFVEAGFVAVPGPPPNRAELAVFVVPRRTGPDAASAWVAVCRALDRAGRGCVLAGPLGEGRADAGPLSLLRKDRRAAAAVSSVEGVDLPAGRVALVLALAEQAAEGAGHYGPDGAADGVLPAEPTPGR